MLLRSLKSRVRPAWSGDRLHGGQASEARQLAPMPITFTPAAALLSERSGSSGLLLPRASTRSPLLSRVGLIASWQES